jgi:hypothetical protein
MAASVVALGVLAVRQQRELATLKDAIACEQAAVKKQAAAKRAQAAASVRPAEAGAARRPHAKDSPAPPAAPAVARAPAAGTNFMGAVADMMKNPQMKEMMRAQQKVMIGQMYGALPRYLSLPAEAKEQLDKLLLDRHLALAESGIAMLSGSAEDRNKAMEESKDAKAEYDRAIEELLGDQDYDIFKQYEQSVSEQTTVSMFKNTLTGDDGLSEQQECDLVAAMYQARKELPQDSLLSPQSQSADPTQLTEARIAETLKQMEALQKRYAESAATVLSEAQLARFKQWQQQMAAMQQAGLKMSAQMFGQGQSGAAATQK